jgi:hypothetical protein
MSALGELPPVDAAVHADTTHERSETYAFAAKWTPWLEERGVRVVTVNDGRCIVIDRWDSLMLPVYTTYPDGTPSGMMRRQCTHAWKIAPIRRWLQANRRGRPVEMWMGITLDEWDRMRDSRVQYLTNHYPFIEDLDRPWTRGMAMRWLRDNDLDIPIKSRCVFCPFQSDADWRESKQASTDDPLDDWERALTTDSLIRRKRDGYVCYLHRSCQPLARVDLRNEQDHGQLELWGEECTGNCFL